MPITQEMIVKYVDVIKEVTGLKPNILYNSEKAHMVITDFKTTLSD